MKTCLCCSFTVPSSTLLNSVKFPRLIISQKQVLFPLGLLLCIVVNTQK